MIAIINTGELNGEHQYHYRLQINNELIGTFWHRRGDGLGDCLRLAAKAADLAHNDQITAIIAHSTVRDF